MLRRDGGKGARGLEVSVTVVARVESRVREVYGGNLDVRATAAVAATIAFASLGDKPSVRVYMVLVIYMDESVH